jgi:broad specificity phosphatase PhoE
MRISFICHQSTSALRRAAFPADETLEEADFARAASLGWSAPRAQQLLSGPEHRALQTAQALGLSAIAESGLRDCDYGRWKGLELDEVQLREPEQVVAWLTDAEAAPHGGESIMDVIGRVGRWLDRQHDSGHTVAVTHPAVIRAAIVYALDAPLSSFWRVDIAPLTLTDLRFNGRAWTLRCVGCALVRSERSSDES